jgi:hypothetical protein
MASPVQTVFADSTQPGLIPGVINYAGLYGNGQYMATAAQKRRFKGHFLIGVKTAQPSQAKSMRGLDIERWDASPWDGPKFVAARNSSGHNDALLYGSLSTIAQLLALLVVSPQWTMPWGLWVAWPWGRTYPPSRRQVHDQVVQWSSVPVPESRVKACQWLWTPRYDQSAWYGQTQWTLPDMEQSRMEA